VDNDIGILQKLWVWAEEFQLNSNELKKKLLLAKDKKGFTALEHAEQTGTLEALVTLLSWSIELVLKALNLLLV
jgi:hypothetical protein